LTELLRTLGDYELFIYSLPEAFPLVLRSTLRVIRRGATLALVTGEVELERGFRPDIKHHRVPAPELSFSRPNLPALIREIEQLLREQVQR
jgi:hypothetical protein